MSGLSDEPNPARSGAITRYRSPRRSASPCQYRPDPPSPWIASSSVPSPASQTRCRPHGRSTHLPCSRCPIETASQARPDRFGPAVLDHLDTLGVRELLTRAEAEAIRTFEGRMKGTSAGCRSSPRRSDTWAVLDVAAFFALIAPRWGDLDQVARLAILEGAAVLTFAGSWLSATRWSRRATHERCPVLNASRGLRSRPRPRRKRPPGDDRPRPPTRRDSQAISTGALWSPVSRVPSRPGST